jgi:hypothetical protein
LAKLASKIFLKILGISNCGMGYILQNAFSQIEKNKELGDIIFHYKLFYVRMVKVAWNATLWEWEFGKST